MLYQFLKILCRLTLKTYFRRLKVVGVEKIPSHVPVIFVANHPSAFMDPILVAASVKPPLYFIAAGEYVGKGLKGFIFRKWLHMIPVYRPSTRPEDVHKNKDMFNACFDHLGSGRSLLIFPEGVSVTERKLKPFKTGVARIARGAELIHKSELNIHIVPVGLNYSNPHEFRSDVFIKIGNPIPVNQYITTEESNEIKEVQQLTEISETEMMQTTLHVPSSEDEEILKKLESIYSRDLKQELGIKYHEQEREFEMQQDMLAAIQYFRSQDPQRFEEVTHNIDQYLELLNQYGLNDKDIKELRFQKSFRRIGTYILGFPFFLVGLILNILPYRIVIWLMRKLRFNETFLGSLIFASGLVIFLIYYSALAITALLFSPVSLWSLLLPVVAYATGVYALMYLSAIRYTRQRKNLRKVLMKNQQNIENLKRMREQLIHALELCRVEYQNILV